MSKLLRSAVRQSAAVAGTGRQIKWYFAEKAAGDIVRKQMPVEYDIKISYMRATVKAVTGSSEKDLQFTIRAY